MAGQIAELAHRTLKRDFRRINTERRGSSCVDAAPQVLPPFGEKLGARAQKELEKLGVEVMLGAMVTDVDECGIEMKYKDGRTERIDSITKVWAAGVQASPLGKTPAEQTGAPLDRAGRIGVNPDLTLPGHPEVFVVGDMIASTTCPVSPRSRSRAPSTPPRRSRPAEGQARANRSNTSTRARWPPSPGSSAVAMWAAAGDRLPRLADLAAVHLFYITGFNNRVTAMLHWAISFLGRGRSERTSTVQQIFARTALARLEHGATDLVSDPGEYDAAAERVRREELEAQALEEARLTDDGVRGVKVAG